MKMLTRKPAGVVSRFSKPLNGAMVVKKKEKASSPSGSQKVKKATYSRRCVDQNSPAMKRACEFIKKLPNFPYFVKLLLHSHVRGGFWLGLGKSFTDANLPIKDVTVVLIDENDCKYDTKFLAAKTGLSGGWRAFAVAHKLNEGDVLIFQLIKPCIFKVYIVRENDSTENVSLMQLYSEAKPIAIEYPKSSNDDLGSHVMEDVSFSESAIIRFKEVKNFSSFKIVIDNLCIDSEVPNDIRLKYYELCNSQKSLIHEHCVGGLNAKLAAEIISETVNIADAIRFARLTTTCDFTTWDRTLKGFEDLGMGVGFLRKRMDKLIRIASKQQNKMELKEVEVEYAQKEEEMMVIEAELLKLKNAMTKLNSEMEVIERKGESVDTRFKEVAGAQW